MYRLEDFEPIITFICVCFVVLVAFFLLSGCATQDRSLFQALPDVTGTQAQVGAASESVAGFPMTGGVTQRCHEDSSHSLIA